jgi:hypothetical protein
VNVSIYSKVGCVAGIIGSDSGNGKENGVATHHFHGINNSLVIGIHKFGWWCNILVTFTLGFGVVNDRLIISITHHISVTLGFYRA